MGRFDPQQVIAGHERQLSRVRVTDDNELDYGPDGAKRVINVEEIDLSDIEWPDVPCYGYDHAHNTAALAVHIAKSLGVEKEGELNAVRIAGMLHDVGRKVPWQVPSGDPNHGHRSAEFVERYLQKRNAPTSMIERTVRLIVAHDLGAAELPRDPLLQALWDADSFEAARLDPGRATGLAIWRKRAARLCTPFARERDNQRTWLQFRGWNR